MAAADPRENARSLFVEQFHGRAYGSVEELGGDEEVEAIWIATPTHLHAAHAQVLAAHGKNLVVEKPFAVSLEECEQMIQIASRYGVALIAGGARSFDPAFVAMRDVITSGRIGRVGALNTWAFTDWILRPREPYEVDVNQGGGTVYNQAPHPIDVLRLLGGGLVKTVRGTTSEWMDERPCPGYFTGYLEFEDGTPATLSYNGYGYIEAWELMPWGESDERQRSLDASYEYRRGLRTGTVDEYAARERRRFGGSTPNPSGSGGDGNWTPADAGVVIVSCERGEIRQSATGLYVYDDDGRHDEPFSRGGGSRLNEVTELRDAINHEPVLHDGRWGLATMEVVLALMDSASQHQEITLQHQVPVI